MDREEAIDGGEKESVEASSPKTTAAKLGGPIRRFKKGGWTEEEDNMLEYAVKKYGEKNWKSIAELVPNRTDVQCLHRWKKVLNPSVIKGPWTKEEDELIMELVGRLGLKKWSEIARHMPGRIGKQCRERWHNHLNPEIKKTAWTKKEKSMLLKAHRVYGNKWAEIVKFLPGRTENSIKNQWNGLMNKKLKLGSRPSTRALDRPRPVTLKLQNSKATTDTENGSCPSTPTLDRPRPATLKLLNSKATTETENGSCPSIPTLDRPGPAALKLMNSKATTETEKGSFPSIPPLDRPRRATLKLLNSKATTETENGSCLSTPTRDRPRPATLKLLNSKATTETENGIWLKPCPEPRSSTDKSPSPKRSTETSVTTNCRALNVQPSSSNLGDVVSLPLECENGNQNEIPECGKLGCLWYQPLISEYLNVILERGSFTHTDGYLKHPIDVGTQYHGSGMSCGHRSPQSFLRHAARTFTNIPSIVRRRGSSVSK